jgi:LacI family transcriptional regulator
MEKIVKRPDAPLYTQVAELLEKEITDFPIGGRFHTDRQLCEKFNITPQVARSALSVLAEMGYLKRVPSSGTYVASHTPTAKPINGDQKKTGRISSKVKINGNNSYIIKKKIIIHCPFSSGVFHPEAIQPIQENQPFDQFEHVMLDNRNVTDPWDVLQKSISEYDGVIWINLGYDEALQVPDYLLNNPSKIVFINLHILNEINTSVMADNQCAMFNMTMHLLRLGHKKIGYIGGPEDKHYARKRWEGFKMAMGKKNHEIEQEYVKPFSDTAEYDTGHQTAREIISKGTLPDAFVCATDYLALGVIDALKENNLEVPGDVAVSGFDNCVKEGQIKIKLTSIDQAYAQMGAMAGFILKNQMEGKVAPGGKHFVPCPLIIRETCGNVK